MLIPNTLFRVGGAAMVLTNKPSEARRAKWGAGTQFFWLLGIWAPWTNSPSVHHLCRSHAVHRQGPSLKQPHLPCLLCLLDNDA